MLDGKVRGPVGEYDWYVALAERYGWTPQQVNALDPDVLTEILARIEAEGIILAREREKAERERRRAERAQRRAQRERKQGMQGEDVDMAEME